jgi:virginiamycin B lyase
VRIFPLKISRALPYGLVAGHDGGLWMALFGTNAVVRIDPSTGTLREFRVPDDKARPRRLIVDGAGHVWFTNYAQGKLGELDPATGQVREFASPGGTASGPYGIALAPDGRVWYDEAATSRVIVFDPQTAKVDEVVDIPTKGAIVRNMAVDTTRGRLWLALSGTGRIGLVELKAH